VHNEWIESYDPTIEDSYRTQLSVDVWHIGSCYFLLSVSDLLNRDARLSWRCKACTALDYNPSFLTVHLASTQPGQNSLVRDMMAVTWHHDQLLTLVLVAMRDLYMKTGQGFLLVFSITSRASLEELETLREEIHRIKDDTNVPIVVVGNKADLTDQRVVDRAKAFAVCERWSAPYYEASARTRSAYGVRTNGERPQSKCC
jgi:GTPase SAR1 family protein